MFAWFRDLWGRVRDWWAAEVEPITGDNREGSWSEAGTREPQDEDRAAGLPPR